MASVSKRVKSNATKVDRLKTYSFEKAYAILKECVAAKFDESVEVAISLGIDPRKSDQIVRSAAALPSGTGKTVRVAAFAQGAHAEAAVAAGADIVGFEDLAETIKKGHIDFDVLIATPDSMRLVGQLGQVLGPKGLMPNPKVGTVTMDVAAAVRNAKSGQARYRTDKNGIVHCAVGKISFDAGAIKANLDALISDIKRKKPASSKGTYLKKISLSTTMGPGVLVDFASLGE